MSATVDDRVRVYEQPPLRQVAGEHLARYKLPRALVLVDAVKRSPSGKPDYAWARSVASEEG